MQDSFTDREYYGRSFYGALYVLRYDMAGKHVYSGCLIDIGGIAGFALHTLFIVISPKRSGRG